MVRGQLQPSQRWRQEPGRARTRLSQTLLGGTDVYDFVDLAPPTGAAEYWLQEMTTDGSENWYGPAHHDPFRPPRGRKRPPRGLRCCGSADPDAGRWRPGPRIPRGGFGWARLGGAGDGLGERPRAAGDGRESGSHPDAARRIRPCDLAGGPRVSIIVSMANRRLTAISFRSTVTRLVGISGSATGLFGNRQQSSGTCVLPAKHQGWTLRRSPGQRRERAVGPLQHYHQSHLLTSDQAGP